VLHGVRCYYSVKGKIKEGIKFHRIDKPNYLVCQILRAKMNIQDGLFVTVIVKENIKLCEIKKNIFHLVEYVFNDKLFTDGLLPECC
jgi:hypothetical protein